MVINEIQSLNQAINVMIQALDLGREKGIYNFADLSMIISAIDFAKDFTSSFDNFKNEPPF